MQVDLVESRANNSRESAWKKQQQKRKPKQRLGKKVFLWLVLVLSMLNTLVYHWPMHYTNEDCRTIRRQTNSWTSQLTDWIIHGLVNLRKCWTQKVGLNISSKCSFQNSHSVNLPIRKLSNTWTEWPTRDSLSAKCPVTKTNELMTLTRGRLPATVEWLTGQCLVLQHARIQFRISRCVSLKQTKNTTGLWCTATTKRQRCGSTGFYEVRASRASCTWLPTVTKFDSDDIYSTLL